eukprot:2883079-Pyramimonas_sp.AAC.1
MSSAAMYSPSRAQAFSTALYARVLCQPRQTRERESNTRDFEETLKETLKETFRSRFTVKRPYGKASVNEPITNKPSYR